MQVWKSFIVIQLSHDLSKPPNHLLMYDHLICISLLDALFVYLFLIMTKRENIYEVVLVVLWMDILVNLLVWMNMDIGFMILYHWLEVMV